MNNDLFKYKVLSYAKKYKAIELLGGKCEFCGEDRFFRLSFHHLSNKIENINMSWRWEKIKNETEKCKLLCRNCHQELHSREENTIYKISKSIFLEYKNVDGCKECGYNKCNDSLTFHHNFEKRIMISLCRCSDINKLKKSIIDELNKCDVFCHNCHTEKHSDLDFFNKNIDLIIERANKLEIKPTKFDRNVIKKMYFEDKMKQKDIVNYFNCSKGTISDIIKELKA